MIAAGVNVMILIYLALLICFVAFLAWLIIAAVNKKSIIAPLIGLVIVVAAFLLTLLLPFFSFSFIRFS